mgnify:CR=1 FL=1
MVKNNKKITFSDLNIEKKTEIKSKNYLFIFIYY